MKKFCWFALCLSVWSGAVWAQWARQIPKSNLNAVPGPGESEVIFRSAVQGIERHKSWFMVYQEGKPVLQVEPGMPEKLIVKNGYHKFTIQNGAVNEKMQLLAFSYDAAKVSDIVIEAKSDSTTVDLDINTKGINTAVGRVASVKSLAPPPPQAAKTPAVRPAAPTQNEGGIEDALYRAGETLLNTLPENTTIAIVSISSRDREMVEFIIEEIEFILVNSGANYKIVDRKSLDAIRKERDFQMSGEVDDESAVSIGKMLGANIVITGSISGSNTTRRLRLKALDATTAQILAMASERF
jgi:hypothetical protein